MGLEWMAWTVPTALFFILIGFSIVCLTVMEVRLPSKKVKGILPMATTRGERFFISLLGSAFIMMAVLGLTTLSPWTGLFICLFYAFIVFIWG
jgi:predicted small integral membrane protein